MVIGMSIVVPKASNIFDQTAPFLKDKDDTDNSSIASNNEWESDDEYSKSYSFIIKKSKKVKGKGVKKLKKEEYIDE